MDIGHSRTPCNPFAIVGQPGKDRNRRPRVGGIVRGPRPATIGRHSRHGGDPGLKSGVDGRNRLRPGGADRRGCTTSSQSQQEQAEKEITQRFTAHIPANHLLTSTMDLAPSEKRVDTPWTHTKQRTGGASSSVYHPDAKTGPDSPPLMFDEAGGLLPVQGPAHQFSLIMPPRDEIVKFRPPFSTPALQDSSICSHNSSGRRSSFTCPCVPSTERKNS